MLSLPLFLRINKDSFLDAPFIARYPGGNRVISVSRFVVDISYFAPSEMEMIAQDYISTSRHIAFDYEELDRLMKPCTGKLAYDIVAQLDAANTCSIFYIDEGVVHEITLNIASASKEERLLADLITAKLRNVQANAFAL